MEQAALVQWDLLLPVVNKHFGQISAAQWALLAAGIRNPATDAILADMCTEMVQTVAAEMFRMLAPVMARMEGRASPDEVSAAVKKCAPKLRDSIATTFTAAARVPKLQCDGTEHFTAIIEEEAKQRVHAVLNAGGQQGALVYVTATMSSTNTLYEMVYHAHKCMCALSKMTQRFYKISAQTPVDVDAATGAVAAILLKWAHEGREEAEEEAKHRAEDTHVVARDIVRTIVQDGDDELVLSRTRVDMSDILAKVKAFFAARPKPAIGADEHVARSTLCVFAHSQFKKTLAGLRRTFRNKRCPFVVPVHAQPSRHASPTPTSTTCSSRAASEEELGSEFDTLASNFNEWQQDTCSDESAGRLADAVYTHLMATCSIDSLSHPQEVLYAITEDTVRKLVQHMHLWLKVLRVDAKSRVEVSGAIHDIDRYISSMPRGGAGGGEEEASASKIHRAHVRNLVSAVVMTLLMRVSCRCRTTTGTKIGAIVPLIKRLSEGASVEIKPALAAALQDMDTYDAVIQAVVKDLLKEFDSPQQPHFDDALFKLLNAHMQLLTEDAHKERSIGRFFSAFAQVLARPFRRG